MPFFQPQRDGRNEIYFGEPDLQKGIVSYGIKLSAVLLSSSFDSPGRTRASQHCRFGMKNVIAENHFDATRNAIVVWGGRRRYILSHPRNCENLSLLPRGHESGRHSAVDYTDPDLEHFPEFADAMANEVVLEAGQVLYLPTYWFHFIVSLDLNFQCNARSGVDHESDKIIRDCGF